MAVLGKGQAHGACSLLHAAALGYGAAMALDLPVTVRLLDKPSKRELPKATFCSLLYHTLIFILKIAFIKCPLSISSHFSRITYLTMHCEQ